MTRQIAKCLASESEKLIEDLTSWCVRLLMIGWMCWMLFVCESGIDGCKLQDRCGVEDGEDDEWEVVEETSFRQKSGKCI